MADINLVIKRLEESLQRDPGNTAHQVTLKHLKIVRDSPALNNAVALIKKQEKAEQDYLKKHGLI